jgi:hypothetical protein
MHTTDLADAGTASTCHAPTHKSLTLFSLMSTDAAALYAANRHGHSHATGVTLFSLLASQCPGFLLMSCWQLLFPPRPSTHHTNQLNIDVSNMQKRNDRGFADGVMELRPADKAATLYDMEGKVGCCNTALLAGTCSYGVPCLKACSSRTLATASVSVHHLLHCLCTHEASSCSAMFVIAEGSVWELGFTGKGQSLPVSLVAAA